MRPESPPPARRSRARAAIGLWLANVALGCAVAAPLLRYAPSAPDGAERAFLACGLVSCAALVGLAPLALALLGALVAPGRAAAALAGLSFTLTLAILYADTIVFGLFRYHFNGLVWNALVTPGADEAVHLPFGAIGAVLALTFAAAAVQAAVLRALERRAARAATAGRPGGRLVAAGVALVLLCALAFAARHAQADLRGERRAIALARLFPLAPRLRLRGLAGVAGAPPRLAQPLDLAPAGARLAALAPPPIDPDGPRPDVVLIVIDSLRADMLDEEHMPRVTRFAAGGRVFEDHRSGGNGTRAGLFGMLYGLHGTYWWPALAERRPPLLLDALRAEGYDTRVLTSASMRYPELRSTAFAGIEETVEDRLPPERPGGRDDAVVTRFDAWLGARDASRPFFALLLLDAPHQGYAFPEEHALFRPYASSIDYRRIGAHGAPDDLALAFRRYRNAVHYADATAGALLDALERHGRLERSVVVVTGDHGEEFGENGFFGHTANFTPEQVHVPLVLRGPGVPPGVERAPTSHVDLPATLLECLGADPAARARWTLGASLLAPEPERPRVGAGWHVVAIEAGAGRTLLMPEEGELRDVDLYDRRWRLAQPELDEGQRALLLRLGEECRRFLAPPPPPASASR